MSLRRCFVLAAGLVLAAAVPRAAQSAVLIIEDGKLTGATGVRVGDDVYDVEFRDGTCFDLFAGCDEDADFPINWLEPDTYLAAQAALYDQVFLGVYDTEPERTAGCTNTTRCEVFFPIQKLGATDGVGFATTSNEDDLDPDTTTGTGGGPFRFQDYGLIDYRTYAIWNGPLQPPAVPLQPALGLVLGAALLATAGRALARGSS